MLYNCAVKNKDLYPALHFPLGSHFPNWGLSALCMGCQPSILESVISGSWSPHKSGHCSEHLHTLLYQSDQAKAWKQMVDQHILDQHLGWKNAVQDHIHCMQKVKKENNHWNLNFVLYFLQSKWTAHEGGGGLKGWCKRLLMRSECAALRRRIAWMTGGTSMTMMRLSLGDATTAPPLPYISS